MAAVTFTPDPKYALIKLSEVADASLNPAATMPALIPLALEYCLESTLALTVAVPKPKLSVLLLPTMLVMVTIASASLVVALPPNNNPPEAANAVDLVLSLLPLRNCCAVTVKPPALIVLLLPIEASMVVVALALAMDAPMATPPETATPSASASVCGVAVAVTLSVLPPRLNVALLAVLAVIVDRSVALT